MMRRHPTKPNVNKKATKAGGKPVIDKILSNLQTPSSSRAPSFARGNAGTTV
jgi:hypothetical protein